MSTLALNIYGKDYEIACDDGQEAHVNMLASTINNRIKQLASHLGNQPDTMMLVLTALMLADEGHELQKKVDELQAQVHSLLENNPDNHIAEQQAALAEQENAYLKLLETVSEKIESMAELVEKKAA